MPSIEVICVNQLEPIYFIDLPFRVQAEKELIAHRSPYPLFQSDFDGLKGCIYHLLEEGGITAYELLERDWYDDDGNSNGLEDNLEFIEEVAPYVHSMLETLLKSSPVKQVLFTSDYQFGPKPAKRFAPIPFAKFWELHDIGKIRMNAAYWINAS
jgi:hypothetical protein